MADPVSAAINKEAIGMGVKISTGVVKLGYKWITRYYSPTISLVGQNNSGKTTLRDYFVNGYLDDDPIEKEETQEFKSRLVDIRMSVEGGISKSGTFWARDGRGFFDTKPLIADVADTRPIFIFFIFDIRRIELTSQAHNAEKLSNPLFKIYDTESWTRKFHIRVEQAFHTGSPAQRKLKGAAILINKCDAVSAEEMHARVDAYRKYVQPILYKLEPKLGLGPTNIKEFRTCLIRNKPLPSGEESELPKALRFMFQCISREG